jgi:FMN phosphatase YigB (HAD superfamily)
LRQNPVQFVLCVLNMALAQVPFWFAASAARCRPCELVYIGDDHVADLNGALEAGCRAILVTTPEATRHAFNSERVLGADSVWRPPWDAARWREVSSLDEAVGVVLQRGSGH